MGFSHGLMKFFPGDGPLKSRLNYFLFVPKFVFCTEIASAFQK